jgi:hypothetical protein
VKYQRERPTINLVKDSPNELVEKALLTKADYWSYEEEWRVVDHESGSGVQVFPPQFLDQVIFGANVSRDDAEMVEGWIDKRGGDVQVKYSSMSEDNFRIML